MIFCKLFLKTLDFDVTWNKKKIKRKNTIIESTTDIFCIKFLLITQCVACLVNSLHVLYIKKVNVT